MELTIGVQFKNYVIIDFESSKFHIREVSNAMGTTINDLTHVMTTDFGANFLDGKYFSFPDMQKAKSALNWIDSRIVSNALTNTDNELEYEEYEELAEDWDI